MKNRIAGIIAALVIALPAVASDPTGPAPEFILPAKAGGQLESQLRIEVQSQVGKLHTDIRFQLVRSNGVEQPMVDIRGLACLPGRGYVFSQIVQSCGNATETESFCNLERFFYVCSGDETQGHPAPRLRAFEEMPQGGVLR